MVGGYCIKNLQHLPGFVARRVYFQAFDRLYNAYREFLQALFIARRTHPIAYNKWIREQVEEILGVRSCTHSSHTCSRFSALRAQN